MVFIECMQTNLEIELFSLARSFLHSDFWGFTSWCPILVKEDPH